jgi:Secretion system C-terminal sorting domain
MKNLYLQLLLLFTGLHLNAQNKLLFEYDIAGNQVKRTLCINCDPASGKTTEEIADLKKDDLKKFFVDDLISYYPNPVKEELYLTWDIIEDVKVSSIQLFSLSGQSLKTIEKLESKENYKISFQNYPNGIYNLLLFYTNGDQKAIKVIKQ